MTSILRAFWLDAWPQRVLILFGATIGLLTYGVGVLFFIEEAPEIWREGVGVFLLDAGVRLVAGFLIVPLVALPYYLAALGSRQTGFPPAFVLVAGAEFLFHLWLTIDVLFFEKGSTASVALVVIPFYLCVPIALVWVVTAVAKRSRAKRMLSQ